LAGEEETKRGRGKQREGEETKERERKRVTAASEKRATVLAHKHRRPQYVRVHVCLLAQATRAVEGRKSKGEARSGRTGARTESKSLKIGSHALFNDWTTRFFLPRVFFHKATYAQNLQGDGSEHAAPLCEGPAQFAQFSTEKQRSTEKKKTREKTNFKNHKK